MEELREELHSCICKYGIKDPRTVEVSQQLDIPVTIEQIKKVKGN